MNNFVNFAIDSKHFPDKLNDLLTKNRAKIERLLEQKEPFTWENLFVPLEDMEDELEKFWSPMAHVNAVVNTPQLRECYSKCLPILSAYESAIGQNKALYEAIASIDVKKLNAVQKKIIDDSLLGFKLSGVALAPQQKEEFEQIQTRLADLTNKFENNILDATQAFSITITDANEIKGLPAHALHAAHELAEEKGVSGWILNLEFPCYIAVLTYADNRALRERFYEAFVTRASDQGPHAGQFDNSPIMKEILALRHRKARLLGFNNFAELSIATKMAESTTQITDFLFDLSARSYQQAKEEYGELQRYAEQEFGIKELAPWDVAYVSEKLREKNFNFSQEELRAYFPITQVMQGLFVIIKRLYGIDLERMDNIPTWHTDVQAYRLRDSNGQDKGYVYVDLYARPNKRGGAWMDSLQTRRLLEDGQIQLPIATLTCNFAKPMGDKPAILSHDEVSTLFHEFGHCLHHLLTEVDYLSVAGINGVEWDAVELPSQIFENWCWEKEALSLLTKHIESGEALSEEWFAKLLAAKNFQSAMAMMRQLEFSLFDFNIHEHYSDDENHIAAMLNKVRELTSVIPAVPYNRFPNSFAHIFAGGYAAGYYSYKWAEVLASDAYSRFEEEGIFNPETGRAFLEHILAVGGSKKAAEAFSNFRGRPAKVDALLRHSGIRPQK